MFTGLHVATMLFSDIQIAALERMYTVYSGSYTSLHVNYTTVLKYVKSYSYPKSTINIQSKYPNISSGTGTGGTHSDFA